MVDIGRIPGPGETTRQVQSVSADSRGQQDRRREQAPSGPATRGISEELAIALSEDGRSTMAAHLEQTDDGATIIRVVDQESGETIAVVTPEELRELAEQTGLPTGMLLQAKS